MQTQEGSEQFNRRERASIAAQACQTCRQRKSKCDERRPKCGLCRRLNVDCEYREPLPTKKDKTMVHILDTLARLEHKFDNLSITGSMTNFSTPDDNSPGQRSAISLASSSQTSGLKPHGHEYPRSQGAQKHQAMESAARFGNNKHMFTVTHKILLWPGIYLHLMQSDSPVAEDLHYILQEGTSWFIRQEILKHPKPLSTNTSLPSFAVSSNSRTIGQNPRVAFPTLTIQQIQEYTNAYFNTFNVLYPLLDRDPFMNDIVARLLREGYGDDDVESVLALLVFALGQVALDGLFQPSISIVGGKPSGIRGGSVDAPPGLNIFNEARRRFGFIATQTSLQNVQVRLLLATYYESHGRHLDFWHTTIAASMSCQVLIKSQKVDWSSAMGDLIKRAYWTCVLSEDLYHIDLDLPQSGIQAFEDEVPLPYFHASNTNLDQPLINSERSHFQYHFLAMIALRRLINRITDVIHDASLQTEIGDQYMGPPLTVISEMTRQLDSWRALLPRPLQWSDEDRFDFPLYDSASSPSFTSSSSSKPPERLFTPEQGPVPVAHKYNLDIVTAQLRTRFYQARFIMYRPFVFKALHFPELMTAEDADCCALAIKSACMWPLALAPPKNKKRLVPHLFSWTQNFLGILLIFRMTTENECLHRICEDQVDRGEIERSAALMLDWIRDVKQVDGVAEWSWKILEPLYAVEGR